MMRDVLTTKSMKDSCIYKDSSEMWAIGSVDEANAIIGLAKIHSEGRTKEILTYIQKMMFHLGAEISSGKKMINSRDVEFLLELIEEFKDQVVLPRNFIILEQNQTTAYLSIARAAVRRAERWVVRLRKERKIGVDAVRWMNKLSYLLYILILYELKGNYEAVRFKG